MLMVVTAVFNGISSNNFHEKSRDCSEEKGGTSKENVDINPRTSKQLQTSLLRTRDCNVTRESTCGAGTYFSHTGNTSTRPTC